MFIKLAKTFFGKKQRTLKKLESSNSFLYDKNVRLKVENARLRGKIHKLMDLVPNVDDDHIFCVNCDKRTPYYIADPESGVVQCRKCNTSFPDYTAMDAYQEKLRSVLYDNG
jgi:hypothetical protein